MPYVKGVFVGKDLKRPKNGQQHHLGDMAPPSKAFSVLGVQLGGEVGPCSPAIAVPSGPHAWGLTRQPDPVSVSEGSAVQVASPARRAPPLRSQVPGPTGSRASPQPSAQTANVPRAGALRLSLTNTKVLSSRPEHRPTASPTPFPQEAALSHSAGTSLPRDSPEALWGPKGTSQRF